MNQPSVKLWCIVPAAGIGSRFGAEKPKQYAQLAGKSVLQVTLQTLCKVDFSAIVVAINADDHHWQNLDTFNQPIIETVTGGAQRADSVLAGLDYLKDRAAADDWILVHDVARPCILASDIEQLIIQVTGQSKACGGLLATPVSDTIKQAEHGAVTTTVDRSNLWAALTPQMFRFAELQNALTSMIEQGKLPTDEASAMEHAGAKVMLVKGRADNIKITQSEDLAIAEAIIGYQQKAGDR